MYRNSLNLLRMVTNLENFKTSVNYFFRLQNYLVNLFEIDVYYISSKFNPYEKKARMSDSL
jgi:hypothetical protein